jgi:hypothetical protein
MILQFSDTQHRLLAPVWDAWVNKYLQARYGRSWQWYWMNWQFNHELLL